MTGDVLEWKTELNVPFGAEILESEANELRPIDCDDFIWDSKLANNIFPNNFFTTTSLT